MFTNVGGKIKGLAKFICYLGIIASVISGAVLIYRSTQIYYGREQLLISGIVTIALGSLVAWLSSLGLYGFGQLVESTESMEYRFRELERTAEKIASKSDSHAP